MKKWICYRPTLQEILKVLQTESKLPQTAIWIHTKKQKRTSKGNYVIIKNNINAYFFSFF